MSRHDVCNGDADGLCAALQWRLHEPSPLALVTGLKHDIELLDRVHAAPGDEVNVFDVSLQRNRAALLRLLDGGVRVRYFDHHACGELPSHPGLEAHVDLSTDTCTSLLVDRALAGAHRRWALVGAYGDNLNEVADQLADAIGLPAADREQLARLGVAINYNAYGDDESDVRIAPRQLYEILSRHDDPLQMLAHERIADELDAQRAADLQQALQLPPCLDTADAAAYLLPDAPWSRRVIGVLANELANREPDRAHAVLKATASGSCNVSVRAPLRRPFGAHALCSAFGGGGRARAAGIDRLPEGDVPRFLKALAATQWSGPA